MKAFMKSVAVGVTVLLLAVSLFYREINVYTQGAWILFIVVLTLNAGAHFGKSDNKVLYLLEIALFTLLIMWSTVLRG